VDKTESGCRSELGVDLLIADRAAFPQTVTDPVVQADVGVFVARGTEVLAWIRRRYTVTGMGTEYAMPLGANSSDGAHHPESAESVPAAIEQPCSIQTRQDGAPTFSLKGRKLQVGRAATPVHPWPATDAFST
jgi:hypothetical protein